MSIKARFVAMAALAAIGFAALAQTGRNRLYDPSTETTVKGTVSKVATVTGRAGCNGIHLSLQSEDKTWDVHVGPAAYSNQKGFPFSIGDQLEVTGSQVQFNGADALIAREITRGGEVLTLRDKQGVPRWSRGRWTSE